MRKLYVSLLLVLMVPGVSAQEDPANEIAALRTMVEAQSRLLAEQSAQLDVLTQRVARLEAGTEPVVPGIGAALPPDATETPLDGDFRTAPNDVNEISLEHKDKLRTGKETQILDESIVLSENVDIYGSFRTFAEAGDDDPTLNDGSSRLGLRVGRTLANGTTLFGRTEWKVNLVDNDSEFLASTDPVGGGIVVRPGRESSVLSTRLGYLGARIDGVGEVSFGKQWSVYYDVAGWTDNFNAYGGSALSVYPASTDGGALGSGRADNAVVFRNERGPFSYGVQTQLRTSADNDDYKGFAASVIASPSDIWDIGLAFSGARVEGDFELIAGDDKSHVTVLGARYNRGPWHAALSIASWKNHESVFFDDDTLLYDGKGAELYASYEYSPRLQLYGGFNITDPDIDDPRVDSDFGIENLILGVSYFATKESFAFAEALISGSKDFTGETTNSVFSLGYRFDF